MNEMQRSIAHTGALGLAAPSAITLKGMVTLSPHAQEQANAHSPIGIVRRIIGALRELDAHPRPSLTRAHRSPAPIAKARWPPLRIFPSRGPL
jgi:hypothetical protein